MGVAWGGGSEGGGVHAQACTDDKNVIGARDKIVFNYETFKTCKF